MHGLLVSGEGGRVQDNQVPLVLPSVPDEGRLLLQEVKRVVRNALDGDAVQLCVARYGVHGVLGYVHSCYLRGSGKGAGQRKAALVAEAVQHAASAGKARHGGVIVKLVQVQPCFLPRLEVNHELHSAAACGEGFRLLPARHPDGRLNALRRQHGGIVPDDDSPGGKQVFQNVQDNGEAALHGDGQRLDDQVIRVTVHNQAGEAVRLAPDEARERFLRQPLAAQFHRLADAPGKKVPVQFLLAAGKTPGDDLGMGVEHGGSQEAVLEILQRHDVPRLGIAEDLAHFRAVNPVVPLKNACSWRNNQTCHVRKGNT